MSQPYVGEIILVGFNFAPAGWAFCDGQLLPISENDVLFQLLGTTYGGDGQSTFGLPDLRGRIPVHLGQGPGLTNFTIGETAGTEVTTLVLTQIPSHTHAIDSTTVAATVKCQTAAANRATPVGSVPAAEAAGVTMTYSNAAADANMNSGAIALSGGVTAGVTGGSQPHDNMQPYLALNYCISLFGIFPSAV